METRGATELLVVETPESVAFTYELAGVPARGLAAALDALILLGLLAAEGLLAVLAVFLAGRLGVDVTSLVGSWIIAMVVAVVFLTFWGYYIIGETVGDGRTPGKRALGLRVVRDDGSPIGPMDSVIRNVVRVVDLLPGTYALAIWSAVLSGRNKRLGDFAAGTVVVRESSIADTATAFEVADEEGLLLAEYAERREGLTEDARMQLTLALLSLHGESVPPGVAEPSAFARLRDLSRT